MKKKIALLPILLLWAAVLSCNLTPAAANVNPWEVQTLSAYTVAAVQFQTLMAQQGNTPAAGETPIIIQDTPTTGPSITPLPTVTPTFTLIPTITNTPVPCNWAQYLGDVTVPDNWVTSPSDHFTKTWRIKNRGSCTWTSGYQLIFDHGDPMGEATPISITSGTVAPGATVEISVNLLSPAGVGTYQGWFKLRAPDSSIFGIGESGHDAFWVKIIVGLPDLVVSGYQHWPTVPHVGEAVDVHAKIKNQGNLDAGAFTVLWYGATTFIFYQCSWNVSSLAAGAEVSLPTCTWSHGYGAPLIGAQIKVVVDPTHAVTEGDEGNNVYLKPISVVP